MKRNVSNLPYGTFRFSFQLEVNGEVNGKEGVWCNCFKFICLYCTYLNWGLAKNVKVFFLLF